MDMPDKDSTLTVKLEGYFTIESVKDIEHLLTEALVQKKNIHFLVDKIEMIDTPALQLILSFTLAATKNAILWEWHNPSKILIQSANLLGCRELLKLPEN